MRMILLSVLCAFLLAGQSFAAGEQETTDSTKSQKDKLSYSLGYDVGRRMKKSLDIDPDIFIKAFSEGFAGNKAAMTEQDMRDALIELQKDLKEKQYAEMKRVSERNLKEGSTFLAENGKKEGVVTLASGLQYKILERGTGKNPRKSDRVKVHYRGTLIDGTEFDNSHKTGQPATFEVDQVIKGWTEALQLMREGAKWMLYIPPTLAYGEQGTPRGRIGPNQTLIFEVELISVL